jgi:hypothetical protein
MQDVRYWAQSIPKCSETLSQEMVNGRGLVATSYKTHNSVLDKLKFFYVGRLDVGEPHRHSVGEHKVNQGHVCDKEGLLIVAPGRTADSFQDIDSLGALCSNGQNVVAKAEHVIEGDSENFGVLQRGTGTPSMDTSGRALHC